MFLLQTKLKIRLWKGCLKVKFTLTVRVSCHAPLSVGAQEITNIQLETERASYPGLLRIQNCYATHCLASKKHLASISQRPEPNVSKIQKARHLFLPCARQDPLIQEDKKIQPTKARCLATNIRSQCLNP